MKKSFMRVAGIVAVTVGLMTAGAVRTDASVVDVALQVNAESGEFSTLIAALGATGLTPIVAAAPITVFAPTDAAFAKLGLNAQNIGLLPRELVTQILLYHVTLGKRFSDSVLSANVLIMLNRDFARVRATPDGAFINRSELLAPDLIDIDAGNGVIHVIDTVLIPPSLFRR